MNKQNNNLSANNKRIAKNTLFLYMRMLLTMAISLYTSRVILKTLGVEDYGIYNVVGGIVAMFAFLNTAMASATQRFLNYDMAKGTIDNLNKTFCTSVIVHAIIAIVIILLTETLGLWFFYQKMVIPENRVDAAFWVMQCSILSMVVTILSVPYNAVIIANEKMSAFAYISILEVTLKLLIVFSLLIIPFDKLITYSVLVLMVSMVIRIVYSSYCKRHFQESHFHFLWDANKIREMGMFACWNLIGNLALVCVTQGLNMVLNVFFGPVVNAARGVAVQVQAAVNQVAHNFQMAINPQIVKSYASDNLKYMHSLVCRSSKFSFFLLYIMSLPILMTTKQLLVIWLETPPVYSDTFLQLILVVTLVDALSNPLTQSVSATGNIRVFQLVNGFLMLMCIPITYILLSNFDLSPICVFAVQLVLTFLAHFVKLYMSHLKIAMPISYYAKKVYLKIILVISVSASITYGFQMLFENNNILTFASTVLFSALITCLCICYLGLDNSERIAISSKLKQILEKKKINQWKENMLI